MTNFAALTDQQIIDAISREAQRERYATARVVRYLAEIDSRRLYLELGFNSLFDFATNKLGYSSSAALRRIKAARLTLADPTVATKLETGELNFATTDLLANFLKEPELKTLTQELCGRTREDAEKVVAHLRPVAKTALRDRVTPVVVPKDSASENPSLPLDSDQNTNYLRANAQPESRDCASFGEKAEEQFHISFAMTGEEKLLLDRARQLMFAGDAASIGLGKVIAKALKFFLKHHCPKERQLRREERAAKVGTPSQLQKVDTVPVSSGSSKALSSPREITTKRRDTILARDGYRCAFVSRAGVRCTCTADLEVDHISPLGRGGSSEESNLRVLCRAHNLDAARQTFGDSFVTKKIMEKHSAARLDDR